MSSKYFELFELFNFLVNSMHHVGKHVTKLQLFGTGCTAIGCFAAVLVTALAYDMALNNYIVIATSGTF